MGCRGATPMGDASLYCAPADRRPSRAAIVTRSGSESAFILRIIWPRCAFTVISLIPSSPPTCLFSKPETTSPMTWRSRGECWGEDEGSLEGQKVEDTVEGVHRGIRESKRLRGHSQGVLMSGAHPVP